MGKQLDLFPLAPPRRALPDRDGHWHPCPECRAEIRCIDGSCRTRKGRQGIGDRVAAPRTCEDCIAAAHRRRVAR